MSRRTANLGPSIPPKYEEIFHLTKGLIKQKASVWTEYMQIMNADAEAVSQNRLPLPPARFSLEQIVKEVNHS
jgi:hypothetical protein